MTKYNCILEKKSKSRRAVWKKFLLYPKALKLGVKFTKETAVCNTGADPM